jgi:2-oxoglutarate ferredoxin oxidoreductase subunit gamma
MTFRIGKAVEIRLGGLGGQGVILAGVLLGQAAVNDGLHAAGSNSYGAQARGSACKAEVIISPTPIDYPHVENADLLVAMSQGAYGAFGRRLSEEGEVFYDSGLLVLPEKGPKERGLDITAISLRELKNKQVANVIWVGVVAGAKGWFTRKALEEALREHVPERFFDLNLRALTLGLDLGRTWKEA